MNRAAAEQCAAVAYAAAWHATYAVDAERQMRCRESVSQSVLSPVVRAWFASASSVIFSPLAQANSRVHLESNGAAITS